MGELVEVHMTKERYIEYLRTQAYWLLELASDIESGKPRESWCSWAVDFELLDVTTFTERKEDKQVA